jgi:hypothetical protein
VSEANAHTHWRQRQKRAKEQRGIAAFKVSRVLLLEKVKYGTSYGPPSVVGLVRIAPRALDDDNLQGALKHVRDGVADALGVNDRDPRVTWQYAQEKGDTGQYAVRIEIRAKGGGHEE